MYSVISSYLNKNRRAGETVFVDPVRIEAAMFSSLGSCYSTMAYPCTSMTFLHREGVLERYPMLHTGYSNLTTSF